MPVVKLLASDLMLRAGTIILDETNVRWPLPELCKWVNDATREIVLQKPSAYSKNIVVPLVAGTLQEVPADYISILRVVRNITSESPQRVSGRAVRVVSREVLDTQQPDWHDTDIFPPEQSVKHYVFDEQDPMHFYVYPPNDGTGKLEAIVQAMPETIVIAAGADENKIESYAIPFPLQDIYFNAALDFVLYRAYEKDAQFAGNPQRSALHYQQFANSLGIKAQIDVALSPNTAAATKAS